MTNQRPTIWRRLRGSIRPLNLPRHYALGVVVGMVIGLVPKFSIVPWAMMMVGLVLPTHMLSMIVSAIFFSFVSPALDAESHRLGAALLTDKTLTSFWQSLFSSKFAVWFQFHNSVVLGSSLIALIAALPVFVLSRAGASYLKPIVAKHVFSNRVADWIRGYPLQAN